LLSPQNAFASLKTKWVSHSRFAVFARDLPRVKDTSKNRKQIAHNPIDYQHQSAQ
jgi:hypothetical protein